MSAGSSGSLRPGSRPGSRKTPPSRTGSLESSYEERCVDPVEEWGPVPDSGAVHKADPKDANGKECETIGFIPGSAEPSSATQGCNPCASPRSCRTFVCSLMTCGLYRVCQRTILALCPAPDKTSTDQPEEVSLRAVKEEDAKEEDGAGWLGDIHIGGVKIDCPNECLKESPPYVHSPTRQTQPGHVSFHHPMGYDDWDDGEEDVDHLITKKLLDLYTEYQIEELARCTSDSVFRKKTKTIDDLINSLATEHQMDEQEAECRLVRGIIRISTRKSARRPPVSKRERTLSDSGNDTMRESESSTFSNNNDYISNPNIQISKPTESDKWARDMWMNNGGHIPSSPTAYSPSHTETNSSGVSLIHNSVRT